MSERATLTITALAAGGAGVGRLDGMAVFVPRSAPDDVVQVRLRRYQRHATGAIEHLVRASEQRVSPRCEHFGRDRCGGCQWQHLRYDVQLEAKHDIVVQALRRIAKREPTVAAVVPAPQPFSYRNKLTLTIRARGNELVGGLRAWDAPDEVFALTSCDITNPAIVGAWREIWAARHTLPRAPELRAILRLREGVVSLVLKGGTDWPCAAEFAEQCPALGAIRHDAGDSSHAVSGEEMETLDAFVQVNPSMAALLQDWVVARARSERPHTVVDAYGGEGRVAEQLADSGSHVILIELESAAVRAAVARLGHRVDVREGRVEDVLAACLPADVVILNPPRSGVDARVCHVLEGAEVKPRSLIYVSCDPATLSRDLARLPSYRALEITPFDMFPQTAHVETVCVLAPGNS